MRVAVATIQRGRHEHLRRQAAGIGRQTVRPDDYVVVSMDPEGPDVARLLGDEDGDGGPYDAGGGDDGAGRGSVDDGVGNPGGVTPRVLRRPVADGEPLPLAAARNVAIAALDDADLVVLLDVDCIPGPEFVARYAAAARERDGLLAGPVGHLPPGRPTGLRLTGEDHRSARVRGSRPVPRDDEVLGEPRHELFWSLSFAVRPATHRRIGGFDEGYAGYGGEDTDYAFAARSAGVGLSWVGGAWAYHQDHPVSDPPYEHLDDIVRNARRFHERWGRWPMEGWLGAFAAEGLVDWAPGGAVLDLVRPAPSR